jgi:hypothetical protein
LRESLGAGEKAGNESRNREQPAKVKFHGILPFERRLKGEPSRLNIFGAIKAPIEQRHRVNTFLTCVGVANSTSALAPTIVTFVNGRDGDICIWWTN